MISTMQAAQRALLRVRHASSWPVGFGQRSVVGFAGGGVERRAVGSPGRLLQETLPLIIDGKEVQSESQQHLEVHNPVGHHQHAGAVNVVVVVVFFRCG